MHWVQTNISSIYYFTEIPIILKQHIQSDWITNELRKPWADVLGTLSAHGYSKLWRTSSSMNKPTTWCKSGRVGLVSSSCLYKTQPERALAQVCHTRIDTDGRTDGQTDRVNPVYPPQLRCGRYKNIYQSIFYINIYHHHLPYHYILKSPNGHNVWVGIIIWYI